MSRTVVSKRFTAAMKPQIQMIRAIKEESQGLSGAEPEESFARLGVWVRALADAFEELADAVSVGLDGTPTS